MLSNVKADVQPEVAELLRQLPQQHSKVVQHVEVKLEEQVLRRLLNRNKPVREQERQQHKAVLALPLAEAVDKRLQHSHKTLVLNRQHKEQRLVKVRALGTKQLHSKDRHKIRNKVKHNSLVEAEQHSNPPPQGATNRQLHHRQDQVVNLAAQRQGSHQDNQHNEAVVRKT